MDRDELYDAGGVFIGVLAIIILIFVISYCHRRQSPVDPSEHDESSATVEQGLDEATICGYPKILYSEAKLHSISISSSRSCCCICLADFEDKDVLRSVPNCGHFFHQICVDKWLQLHPTCPICRNSLLDPFTSVASVAELPLQLEKGFNDFILETDCAVLATALASLEEDFSDVGRIIGDCKAFMLAFTNVKVCHIYREANAVANRLAHITSFF